MCIPHPAASGGGGFRRRKRCKDKDYFRNRKPLPPFCAFFLRNRGGNCRIPFRSVTKSFPTHPHTLVENPVNLLPLLRLGSQILCPPPRQKTETPAPDGKNSCMFRRKAAAVFAKSARGSATQRCRLYRAAAQKKLGAGFRRNLPRGGGCILRQKAQGGRGKFIRLRCCSPARSCGWQGCGRTLPWNRPRACQIRAGRCRQG